MPRNRWFWLGVGAFAVALAALVANAGDAKPEKKKCPYPTQDCLNMMAEKQKNAGWVGIEYEPDEQANVWEINTVFPGSPAEKAGLQPGDRIYAIDGVSLADREKLKEKKEKEKSAKPWGPGQSVTYSLKRAGKDKQISITLGAMPADVFARIVGEHMLEHAQLDMAKK